MTIQSGQQSQLTIHRNGDLTQLAEIKLSHQLNWLTIDNEALLFVEGQDSMTVNLAINQLTSNTKGNIDLTAIDGITVYDYLTISGVALQQKQSSGGALFNLLFLLIVFYTPTLRKIKRRGNHLTAL